jgi:hypothetical protein
MRVALFFFQRGRPRLESVVPPFGMTRGHVERDWVGLRAARATRIWIKLWQRKQHSHPVSRSSASPATSLVLRPTRCVHRILALHMLLRTAQSTRTFLTTVGHPARLLTSQTWRTLPHFRSPITYPLILSPPCLRKGEGAAAYRACSPLRSGPRNALELPVCAPTTTSLLRWASNQDGLVRATTGDQHRMQPLQLPDTPLKAILTAST